MTSTNFGEEAGVFLTVKGVAPHEHGVEHDAEAPHIGHATRVARVALEDLGADVSGAAVLVRQPVVVGILEHDGVLQRLQLQLVSARKRKKRDYKSTFFFEKRLRKKTISKMSNFYSDREVAELSSAEVINVIIIPLDKYVSEGRRFYAKAIRFYRWQ